MPNYFKVTNTTSITGTVTAARVVQGKFGENRQFDLATPNGPFTVEEGHKAVDRELGNLRLTLDQIVGKTVEFSKSPMPDDPSKGKLSIRILATGAPLNAPQRAPAMAAVAEFAAATQLGSLGDFDRIVGPDPRAAAPAPQPATNGASSNGNSGQEAWSRLHRAAFSEVIVHYLPALQQAGGDVAGAISALTFQLAKGWSDRGAGR